MNKYLTLVLALSVVSAPAFASRARLEALGEGGDGSYYIDDARDIFLNPAQIVHYKKKLWLETGTDPSSASTAGNPVSVTPNGTGTNSMDVSGNSLTSRAQGGFSNTFGDFTYGVYLNHDSQKTLQNVSVANGVLLKQAANPALGGNTFVAPDSNIELFFAGEGPVNWGVSAWFAGNDQSGTVTGANTANATSDRTAKQIGARLGVEAGALQVFTTVGIVSKSYLNDASNTELDGKVGVEAGATYKMNDMTGFAKFLDVGSDVQSNAAGFVSANIRDMAYGIGTGWKKEMTKSTNLFSRVEADFEKLGVSGQNVNTWNIPVAVGAEAQALSWLTIRGSIQESVIGEQYGNNPLTGGTAFRNSLAGTTTVALGLGLTFGDVQIDGLVATGGSPINATNNSVAGNTAGFGTAPQSSGNFGFGDNMLTRLAVTYNF
jgi:hypothetical protein